MAGSSEPSKDSASQSLHVLVQALLSLAPGRGRGALEQRRGVSGASWQSDLHASLHGK